MTLTIIHNFFVQASPVLRDHPALPVPPDLPEPPEEMDSPVSLVDLPLPAPLERPELPDLLETTAPLDSPEHPDSQEPRNREDPESRDQLDLLGLPDPLDPMDRYLIPYFCL